MVVIMSINRQRRIEATYEDNNTSFLENKGSTSLQQVRSSKASTLKKTQPAKNKTICRALYCIKKKYTFSVLT
jgi:hypothetical protein